MRGEEKDKRRFFSLLFEERRDWKTSNCKGRDILVPRKLAMDAVNISFFLEMFNLLFFPIKKPAYIFKNF